jgi:hypothetical protein
MNSSCSIHLFDILKENGGNQADRKPLHIRKTTGPEPRHGLFVMHSE